MTQRAELLSTVELTLLPRFDSWLFWLYVNDVMSFSGIKGAAIIALTLNRAKLEESKATDTTRRYNPTTRLHFEEMFPIKIIM